jgi:cysteine desulfurase/selenocysteine lyase
MSSPLTFENAREQFPVLDGRVYLDAACVSLAPRVAIDAVSEFLEMAGTCHTRSATLHHITMDEMRAATRPEVARLLNADKSEIALVESTTHGLNIAAEAIPLESGDRVLIGDTEFMEVAVPWLQLRSRGVSVDTVPHRDGAIVIEDLAARITGRTRVVAISSVQWSSGFRCDLAALSALCRERGVWLVVDAIQQLGAVPIDVRETPVDFLACGGHKWLNAPFGCGFLYIRRERLAELRRPLTGYLNVETPDGGWGKYFQTPSIGPVRDYEFTPEARRYEIGGTSNYPGAIGLAASLRLIGDLGQRRIAGHIKQLIDHLIGGLLPLGMEIITPSEPGCRAGIVTFSAGSAAENTRLMEQLLDRNILVSVRYSSGVGGIRVSCHFFNNLADVDRLLEVVTSSRRARPSTPTIQ